MTTRDLNIPETPNGADPLTAAGFHSKDEQPLAGVASPNDGQNGVLMHQTSGNPYLLYSGDLLSLPPGNGSRGVLPATNVSSNLLPTGSSIANGTGFKPFEDVLYNLPKSLPLGTTRSVRQEAAINALVDEAAQDTGADDGAAEYTPFTDESPKGQLPRPAQLDKPSAPVAPVIPMPGAIEPVEQGAGAGGDWFTGYSPADGLGAALWLEACDAGFMDTALAEPRSDAPFEFVLMAATLAGIPTIVGGFGRDRAGRSEHGDK
jgi:hypothetical protein